MSSIAHTPQALSILTWNLQGATTEGESLFTKVFNRDAGQYAVMCLQEIGAASTSLGAPAFLEKDNDLSVWYRHLAQHEGGWCIVHLAFGKNEGGSRCSTAIAIRMDEKTYQHWASNNKTPTFKHVDPKLDAKYHDSRRILCVQHPASSLWICCVHAPASGRASAYLKDMYTKIATKECPRWIAVGDHNVAPTDAPSGGTGDNKWGPIAPTAPTHNARTSNPSSEYDYVTTNQQCKAVDVIKEISALSDHRPAIFTVQPSS
jgi:exonuclease III